MSWKREKLSEVLLLPGEDSEKLMGIVLGPSLDPAPYTAGRLHEQPRLTVMYTQFARTLTLSLALLIGVCANALAVETISGTISAAGSGLPLSGIDLDAFDAATGASVAITGGKSVAGGSYTFTLPGPGTYIVRADPNALQGYAAQYYNGSFLKSTAQPIVVGPGAAIAGINFSLGTGVSITGTITSGGLPLDAMDIDVYAANGEFLGAYPGKTIADGSYEVGALPPGTYYLRADPNILLDTQLYVRAYFGGGPDRLTSTPIVVGSLPVTGINIDLTAGGTIRGTVTDASTGAPLSGFDLDVFDLLGNRVKLPGKTDINGAFELGAVAPGTYLVRVDPSLLQGYERMYYPGVAAEADAAPVGVATGARTLNVDFAIGLGGTISGTIVEAAGGTPLLAIDLDLYSSTLKFMATYTAKSDLTGAYQLGPLAPGTYYVRADPSALQGYAQQYHAGRVDINLADPIVVTAGADTPGINFALIPASSISGTITASLATPLAGIDLDLLDATGLRLRKGATTAIDGSYTIDSLSAGSYIVRADPSVAQGLARVYYNGKVTSTNADVLAITAGVNTVGIDFVLPAAASISGTVRTGDGAPLPQVAIELYHVQGLTQSLVDKGATTDLNGTFTVESLPPADYIVHAVPDPLLSAPLYHGDTVDPLLATVVTVAAGQNASGADVSFADIVSTPQSRDQQACINGLNRDFAKVSKAQSKQVAGCIKSATTGRLTGTVDACMNSDPRSKVARASAKTVSNELRNCIVQLPDFGPTDSATVNQAAILGETALIHDIFGIGVDAAIFPSSVSTRVLGRCQSSVVKQLQKCRLSLVGGFNACKKEGLDNGSLTVAGSLQACLGADPRGKAAKACSATVGKLGKTINGPRCAISGPDIAAAFPACNSATIADLGICLEAKARCNVCRALNSADAMAGDCDIVDDGVANASCP